MPGKKTLSLRLQAPSSSPEQMNSAAGDKDALIQAALARRLCLSGVYNNGVVVLAPLLLFREHDVLFLLAGTLLRDGKPPREAKLGIYRLSGLSELMLDPSRTVDATWNVPDDWRGGRDSREMVARIVSERS